MFSLYGLCFGVFIYHILVTDKSVHLVCEVNRKRVQFKIPLCFYKYCLKLSKGRSFPQHAGFAFLVIWLLGLILVTWQLWELFFFFFFNAFLLSAHRLI